MSSRQFVFITEILWRIFWRNKWQSLFDVVKNFCLRIIYLPVCNNHFKKYLSSISYRSSIKKVLAEPYTHQSVLDKAECMDLVKYDLAIVTMEISVSTYSEMVREEATSIGNDLAAHQIIQQKSI